MLPKLAVLSRGGVQPKHAKPSTKPPRPPLGTFSYRVGVCIDEALIVPLWRFLYALHIRKGGYLKSHPCHHIAE